MWKWRREALQSMAKIIKSILFQEREWIKFHCVYFFENENWFHKKQKKLNNLTRRFFSYKGVSTAVISCFIVHWIFFSLEQIVSMVHHCQSSHLPHPSHLFLLGHVHGHGSNRGDISTTTFAHRFVETAQQTITM